MNSESRMQLMMDMQSMAESRNAALLNLAPHHYIHVRDTNSNITSVVCGPCRFTREDHQQVVFGPIEMVKIPPRHFITVENPVIMKENGMAEKNEFGQAKLRHGDTEIRLATDWAEPFPLYYGEKLLGKVTPLRVVAKDTALRLKAVRDFSETDDENGGELISRLAGDEWLFEGPGTYTPRVEVEIVETVTAAIIKHGEALKLRAQQDFQDSKGTIRKTGQEYLVRENGAYMPSVHEEVVELLRAKVVTEKKALHLKAVKGFKDIYGNDRRAGDEYLITAEQSDSHILDVYEELVGEVHMVSLSSRQYCVVLDAIIDGVQKFGTRTLRKGESCFFLQPGESLENGIEDIVVLSEDEALLLQANETFDDDGIMRKPGDKWLVTGPKDVDPSVNVTCLEKRKAIPLASTEGIYVRDNRTGDVRSVIGKTYLLQAHEELYEKDLPDEVEELLLKQRLGQSYLRGDGGSFDDMEGAGGRSARDKTRVVSFRVPHNSAIQIYDYKTKDSRLIFGPDLVMLGPDENFNVIRLSGDKPKVPNVIKSLCLMLGPDFMTDIITVETSDHARLRLTLSYNWQFQMDDADDPSKIFNVRDFTGDACKAIASRVRGAVAAVTFDHFHKTSAKLIRSSVFGTKADGKIGNFLKFEANSLVITNVDIQSVEPVDVETRAALQKSVQMAITITTNSQEAAARHHAMREDEAAKGTLLHQQLVNQAESERAKKELLELKAQSAAVESTGLAKAEALARAEAARIKGEAAVTEAELSAKAAELSLQTLKAQQLAEVEHQKALAELEIEKARKLADIESEKFAKTISALGPETIVAIARAGPEMQAKLLQGLGVSSMLITDGNSPINLLNTAEGLISSATGSASHQ